MSLAAITGADYPHWPRQQAGQHVHSSAFELLDSRD
jgi:hypothetical protein